MAGQAAGRGRSLLLQHEDSSAFLSQGVFTFGRERAAVPLTSALQTQTEGALLQWLCSLQPDDSRCFCIWGARLSFEAELCESPTSISLSLPPVSESATSAFALMGKECSTHRLQASV